MTLEKFIKTVDEKVEAELGVSIHDLADIDFSNYFDEDLSDSEADTMAGEVVSDIKYDHGLLSMADHLG
jgi:Mg2+/Co2+ transporter CorC